MLNAVAYEKMMIKFLRVPTHSSFYYSASCSAIDEYLKGKRNGFFIEAGAFNGVYLR